MKWLDLSIDEREAALNTAVERLEIDTSSFPVIHNYP